MRITSRGILFAILGLSLFVPRVASAANLYAATAAGAAGELYIISSADGSTVQDVGPLNDSLGTNYPITGMAFNPLTGVLYGSTGNAGAVDATLVTINPTTALVTVVGAFNAGPTNSQGVPSTMGDISFDSSGNLFGVGTIGGPNLYSINPLTGQATLIGLNGASTSTSGGGLAISAAGVFYGTPTSSRFGTYDSTTGVYTNIANPDKPAGTGAYGALTFDGSTLYGLNVGPGSPPPTAITIIDPATGAVTNVGTSIASLDALAAPVPEPATAALLGGAVGVMALRRRR
jgi:hypothetical protein